MEARIRWSRRALALVATLTLALTACSGEDADEPDAPKDDDTTSASPSPAFAPAPPVGACYRLSQPQLSEAHPEAPPVPCAQPHTTQTYAVTTLAGITAPVDSTAVAATADQQCRAGLRRFVAATPARLALSRVSYAWFVPTQDDLDAGSRWLRCDVAVLRTDTTLVSLPADARGLLRRDRALNRYGRCARTNAAGISTGAGGRACALPHTWRAIAARRLGAAAAPYPGRSVRGDVLGRCEQVSRDYTGNTTGDISVAWRPPTRAQWAAGERFGLCWTRTRD